MARGIPVPAVIPEASKAFILCVPDDAFFYSVVMGAIKTMTFRYYWQGTREQIDAVTERMLTMYYHYQEQTGCMICEMVIDCLENDEATKEALRQIIRGMTANPATDPYGQNVPESELTRDVAAGTNPTCNLDVLWAQCLNVVKITNLAIVDVLQKFEVSTNIAELVNGLIDVVPILGTAKQIIGASGALDLVNYFQESFSEGYLAQYTETPGGVQDQIACDLFCACRADCQITIERVEEVMRARLAEHIEVVTVTDFIDLVETIAGIEPDTTYVVDLAFWFGWVAVRVGNFLFGQTFNGGLDLIVALAADEPSNDWELLCDCPEEWEHTLDFEIEDGDMTAPYGSYEAANGWVSGEIEAGLFYTAISINREMEISIHYMKAVYDMSGVTGEPQTDRIWVDSDISDNYLDTATNADGTGRELEWTGATRSITAFGFTAAASACIGAFCGGEVVVKSITLRGYGTNPFLP